MITLIMQRSGLIYPMKLAYMYYMEHKLGVLLDEFQDIFRSHKGKHKPVFLSCSVGQEERWNLEDVHRLWGIE